MNIEDNDEAEGPPKLSVGHQNKNEAEGSKRTGGHQSKNEAEGSPKQTVSKNWRNLSSSSDEDSASKISSRRPDPSSDQSTKASASRTQSNRLARRLSLDVIDTRRSMVSSDDEDWPRNRTSTLRLDPSSNEATVTSKQRKRTAGSRNLRRFPFLPSNELAAPGTNESVSFSDDEYQWKLPSSVKKRESSSEEPPDNSFYLEESKISSFLSDDREDQGTHDPPGHSQDELSTSGFNLSIHPLSFKDQARAPPGTWLEADQEAIVGTNEPEGPATLSFKDQVLGPPTKAASPSDKSRRSLRSSNQSASNSVRFSQQLIRSGRSSRHPVVSAVEVTETMAGPRLSSLDRTSRSSHTSNLERKAALKRLRMILLAAIVMLTVIVAGVIGAIFAIRSGGTTGDTEQQPTRNPSEAPTSLRPTTAPSNRPTVTTSAAPSFGGPTSSNLAFLSTEELYRAVDLYMTNTNLTLEYGDSIGEWDVSRITDFSRVFDANRNESVCFGTVACRSYSMNEDLSQWDTGRATSLFGIFMHVNDFNGNVSTWDTSGVWNFDFAFRSTAFNQDVSSWDVRSATTMDSLFAFNPDFNQDLSNWQVGPNLQIMRSTFNQARSFNQDLSKWNVAGVRDISFLFYQADQFNGDISTWDTSSVEQMQSTFYLAESFNQPIGNWNVSSVRTMETMLSLARSFNQDISSWNVSNVNTLEKSFEAASSFNQSLCAWGPLLERETTVTGMFGANTNNGPSACLVANDPVIPFGPFCHPCS